MKRVYGFVASCAITVLFLSCQKGNNGNQGPTGGNGTTGATGAAGSSGNTILSGDGPPSSTLGNAGDFYLEVDNSSLYGPKTSGGWGSPVSLQGSAGAAGAAGSSASGAQVDTFPLNSKDWETGDMVYAQISNQSGYGYAAQSYTRDEPNLTQGILDSGMVLVYFTPDPAFNANQWLPIPYTITGYYNGQDLSQTIVNYNYSYATVMGQVKLQFYLTPMNTTDGYADVTTFQIPDARYKIVIVTGTITQEISQIVHKKFSRNGKMLN